RPNSARALAAQLRAIKIPDEHEWTPSRAATWWRNYSPPTPIASLPSGEVQVIMPGRTKEQRPLAATAEEAIAATMAGPADNTRRERPSFPRGDHFDD
ncbi:MAG TPA: hypothetical protein VIV11_25235, partial [Kofleriaceae bacterium]